MIRLLWAASVGTRDYLRFYMPTNIALDAIRTRRGRRWGVPAMLIAVPYVFAASICTALLADGGPGWLNILVLLFIWNAMKFAFMGPVSLVLLIRTKVHEYAEQRDTARSALSGVAPRLVGRCRSRIGWSDGPLSSERLRHVPSASRR
ncbi:sulfate permease [Aeromicrobium endophyticum]|uniref:sulfate permease n=1 Tax=Aeromicrobium endophyticum TaxID=2292704 RepID=UPI0018F5CEF3|nr:sulfate permease [Aeromicrobium endophyticum]